MKTIFLILLSLLLSGLRDAARAEEDSDQRPAAKDTVIVPYDPKKPVQGQHPDKLYVPYDRFLELWEAAKAARAGEKPVPAPLPFALSSARYEAQLEAERVVVTATLELTTYNDPWVSVPMPFNGRMSTLTLDGKVVSLSDGILLVPEPGHHTLAAHFEIPLTRGQTDFGWSIPRSAATRLVLTLPESRWSARVLPDSGIIEQILDGKKVVTAALGSTDRLQVKVLEAAASAKGLETPAAVEFQTVIFTQSGFERMVTAVVFSHPGAARDRYTVRLPRGLLLVDLEAPGLRSWKLTDVADAPMLEVMLTEPVKERGGFTLITERAVSLPADQTAPTFSAEARRTSRITALAADASVEVKASPGAGLRQVEPAQLANPRARQELGETPMVGVWAGDGLLGYRVTPAPSKSEARINYVYQVNRRKIELIAAMQLQAKGGPLFDVSVSVPPGFEVLAVDSQRLQDWWREGDRLKVRFRGTTPEATPLVVHLVRLYAAAPRELEVQPLVLDGFVKVTGEAVIAAHKGVEATLKLKEGGEARELDPEKAATDFQILPPLERKRGFAFKTQAFSGQVALATLPPKLNTAWVLHAQAHEAWVSLSIKAQLTLRQGSVDKATFSLPATLPEARVSGTEVREARSKVAGDRRVYEVQFQDDIYEGVDFTIDVDTRMDAEFALPAPEFPEAQISTGFVVADNASEYEMKLRTDRVVPVRVEDMPWQPTVTKSAGVFRAEPGWKVTMAVEKLEKTEARSAYCAWAEMTTALRRDGMVWHKGVWHLQNRSLQFLPVALPAGAELMSARVAGQGVRADTGTVGGRAAMLIPLIRTKPGDVSYDVELVWRSAGDPLTAKDARKFEEAELLGITVEQTFWNVWLPDEREVTTTGGNLAEVIEVSREVEKGRSAVEELKSLNKLLSSENLDAGTWAVAQLNFSANCMILDQKVAQNKLKLSGANTYTGATKQSDAQVQSKVAELTDLNGEVSQELQKAAEENRRLQTFNQRRFGGGQQQAAMASQPGVIQSFNQTGTPGRSQAQGGSLNSSNAQALLFGQQAEPAAQPGDALQTLNLANQTNPAANEYQRSANVTNGNISNGTVVNGGTLRWSANPANTVTLNNANSGLPAEDGGKSNFYVNDNIVLKEAKAKPDAAKDDLEGQKTLRDLDQLQTNRFNEAGDKKKEVGTAKAPAKGESRTVPQVPAPLPQNMNFRGSNYARGNRAQMEEERKGQQMQQPGQSAYDPTIGGGGIAQAARPMAAPGIATPPPATIPAAGNLDISGTAYLVRAASKPTETPAALAAPVTATTAMPAQPMTTEPPPPTGLETNGRISLEVDFPTEGRVYHFQKVKANGTLELQIANTTRVVEWPRLGVFGGLALLLGFLGRLLARRQQMPRAGAV